MIFNKADKTLTKTIQYKDINLQIVDEYIYLGVKIHQSGSFLPAIKDLSMKAQRAYFSLQSALKHMNVTPRLQIKLFDLLIKPIMLYACEVWGGFGVRLNTRSNQLV